MRFVHEKNVSVYENLDVSEMHAAAGLELPCDMCNWDCAREESQFS